VRYQVFPGEYEGCLRLSICQPKTAPLDEWEKVTGLFATQVGAAEYGDLDDTEANNLLGVIEADATEAEIRKRFADEIADQMRHRDQRFGRQPTVRNGRE
jgi:hypothetical protein